MGTHYKVYIFDDHLGTLNGKSATETAKILNEELGKNNASIYEKFEYLSQADCIVGELRKDHPIHHLEILGKFDYVYFCVDGCDGLTNLKQYAR